MNGIWKRGAAIGTAAVCLLSAAVPVSAAVVYPDEFRGALVSSLSTVTHYAICGGARTPEGVLFGSSDGTLCYDTEQFDYEGQLLTVSAAEAGYSGETWQLVQADSGSANVYIQMLGTELYWSYNSEQSCYTLDVLDAAAVFCQAETSDGTLYLKDMTSGTLVAQNEGSLVRGSETTENALPVLFYARSSSCVVRYLTLNAELTAYAVSTEQICYTGDALTLPSADAPEGYGLTGWQVYDLETQTKTDTVYAIGEQITVTDSLALLAVYSQNLHTVTCINFDVDGETELQCAYGSYCKLPMDTQSCRIQAVDATGAVLTVYNGGDYYWFQMPDCDVSLTKIPAYAISGSAGGCTVSGLVSSAVEGEEVSFTVTPKEGYTFEEMQLSIRDANGADVAYSYSIDGDVMTCRFSMPALDVTMTVMLFQSSTEGSGSEEEYQISLLRYGCTVSEFTKTDGIATMIIAAETGFDSETLTVALTAENGETVSYTLEQNADGQWSLVFPLPQCNMTIEIRMEFEAENCLYGDANADGTITMTDVILLQKVLSDQSTLTTEGFMNANIDGGSSVAASDVSLILQYLSGQLVYSDLQEIAASSSANT